MDFSNLGSGLLSTATNLVGGAIGKAANSLLNDAFGDGGSLTEYLNCVFDSSQPYANVLNFFYQQLYRDFAPDINGYTLIFFIPPDLSGYRIKFEKSNYDIAEKESYMRTVGKIMTYAAVDFSPPTSQIRTEGVSTRSGVIPIASEVSESDSCSITFIDNYQLDIYMFHHIWVEYIREVLEGTVEPDPVYYSSDYAVENSLYACIDYAASFYIVKYRPDMQTVTFVSKCIGIFPQSLPNKELIGTRTSNEVSTLPFTYSCSGYREALYTEKSYNWIYSELDELIQNNFSSNTFGGFLGNILNNASGGISNMMSTISNASSGLGNISGNLIGSAQKAWSTISGKSSGGFSLFTKK